MKKLFLLLAAPATLFLASCGGSKNADTAAAMPGMMETTINVNGNPLTLMVPDSTVGKLQVVEQSWGATEIKVGKGFQISITEGEGDIALTKSDIAGNDVNKFKRFIKDDPNLLFWESEITAPECHFYAVVKPAAVSYVVEDIKGDTFDEKSVQKMIDSAQSIKAKDAAKPNA